MKKERDRKNFAVQIPVLSFLFCFLLFRTGGVSAEQCAGAGCIRLKTLAFDPKQDLPVRPPGGLHAEAAPENRYYIVQSSTPIDGTFRKALSSCGAIIIGFIPERAYLVRASESAAVQLARIPAVRWLGPLEPELKIGPALLRELESARPGEGRIRLTVSSFRGASMDPEDIRARAKSLLTLEEFRELPGGRQVGEFSLDRGDLKEAVSQIISDPAAEYVDLTPRVVPMNDDSVWICQTDDIAAGRNYGVSARIWLAGITGVGQCFAAADIGLDTDACQFRYGSASGEQTLANTTQPPSVLVTNPSNKVITYYTIEGADAYDADPSDPQALPFHGTRVTGCAAGDSYVGGVGHLARDSTDNWSHHDPGDGMAPGAAIVFQDVGDSDGNLVYVVNGQSLLHSQAYGSGARVHNDSYGVVPINPFSNAYNFTSADVDDTLWRLRDYTIFFAAGNFGQYTADGVSTVGGLGAVAKNSVTVGAAGNPGDAVAGLTEEDLLVMSARGPTREGLLKPDVTAPGDDNTALGTVLTSPPDDTCLTERPDQAAFPTGTSFASATAAGMGVLARQYFTDGHYVRKTDSTPVSFDPSNALVKAVMINSGRDMTGDNTGDTLGTKAPVPSCGQGWGRVTLDDALELPGDSRKLLVMADVWNGTVSRDPDRGEQPPPQALTTDEVHNFGFRIPAAGSSPLKITLAWSDPAGEPLAGTVLVNDLDLVVIAPGGVTYRGNHFDSTRTEPYSEPGGGPDTTNAVENVFLPTSAAGPYSIRVCGTQVPGSGLFHVQASPQPVPGDPPDGIDSDRQGYALIVTGDSLFPSAPPVFQILTPLTVICEGDSVDFSSDCPTSPDCGPQPVQYLWDFDDTQTSTLESPTHTFASAGLYHVRLTVTNADGISAESRFPVLIVAGTRNLPGPVGNTLKIVKEPAGSEDVRFTWINIPPEQAAWYNLYDFVDKTTLPAATPPRPPIVSEVPLGIPGTVWTTQPGDYFFQVRGLSCDGLLVGP
jgi:hypothetical protein